MIIGPTSWIYGRTYILIWVILCLKYSIVAFCQVVLLCRCFEFCNHSSYSTKCRPKENENARQELEKAVQIIWNCSLPSPRVSKAFPFQNLCHHFRHFTNEICKQCVAIDAVVELDLVSALQVSVSPELIFTKSGKILYRERGTTSIYITRIITSTWLWPMYIMVSFVFRCTNSWWVVKDDGILLLWSGEATMSEWLYECGRSDSHCLNHLELVVVDQEIYC